MEEALLWLKKNKIICAIVLLSAISILFGSLYAYEVNATEAYTCPLKEESEETEETTDEVVVDIKGAVVNPGVYHVSSDSIVNDVILLAGGLRSDADTSNLNLSKQVSNEMVITVYTKDEVKNMDKQDSIVEEDSKEENEVTNTLISLNTATLEELMTLPGIGEAKAKVIIQYRENCGLFTKKEDLLNIKGIGEKMYEKLESYITV